MINQERGGDNFPVDLSLNMPEESSIFAHGRFNWIRFIPSLVGGNNFETTCYQRDRGSLMPQDNVASENI